MIFKAFVLVVVIFSTTIVFSNSALQEEESIPKLLSLMARSNDLLQRYRSSAAECFNYYAPLIEQLNKDYKEEYKACEDESQNGRSQAEADTLDKRNDFVSRADDSCQWLSKCKQIESAEKVFECFVEAGSKNTKTMHDINNDAARNLFELQENLRLIKNTEYKCTNQTKYLHEKEYSDAYESLNKCITGYSEVPAPAGAPVETNPTKASAEKESSESSESAENSESSEDNKISPESILPEEDITLYRMLSSRFNKNRL